MHPLYNSNEAFTPANRPNLFFPIYIYPDTRVGEAFYKIGFEDRDGALAIYPPKSERNGVQFVWRWGKAKCAENFNREIIGYRTDAGDYRIVQKMRHSTKLIRSILDSKAFTSRRGTAEVEELMGGKVASFPKPVELIKTLVEVGTQEGDLIVDLFAGAATTAHAVMALNAEDSGSRSFIMVQMPEQCPEDSSARQSGYSTVAELAKERMRRAGMRIKNEAGMHSHGLDVGFRVLKIDSSNLKDVYYHPDKATPSLLDDHVDNIKEGRTDEDLLFQVLLDWGVDLSLPIEKKEIDGKCAYFVDKNALAACFEHGIDEAFVKELARRQPLRVLFRDAGYGSDDVKINVEQIFKQLSPGTEVKTL